MGPLYRTVAQAEIVLRAKDREIERLRAENAALRAEVLAAQEARTDRRAAKEQA
jgi:hypothetical protein